ncbi:MAG: capsule assembly Wzi family protein [Chloroflexi bacterium]|nr:MAG: capsule assembly Wzi family protein [Chloroflexota bacterium]
MVAWGPKLVPFLGFGNVFVACRLVFVLLSCCWFVPAALAAPWQGPGDLFARHKIQLLGDAGLVQAPLISWPVPLADLSVLNQFPYMKDTTIEDAARHLRTQYSPSRKVGQVRSSAHISLGTRSLALRGFQYTPRENFETATTLDFLGRRFAGSLDVQAVKGPSDGDRIRFDGSYIAGTFGNWILSFGAQDRWWGPGWDGSLILSTSARPVPGFGFQRKQSLPFQWPVLRLLGPWRLEGFVGQMEGDRFVSHAKFLGMRFSFRPVKDLEVGLSRTAQWGGEGRPEDLESFFNLMIGRDNRNSGGINVANEPGNQVAGVDWRWRVPLFRSANYAIYGQIIGEDEAGGYPSRFIGLGGVEHWGALSSGSYRAYVEAADTTLDFYHSSSRFNNAYEHFLYKTGYRYKGRPLGHSLDNDGRSVSLGWIWTNSVGNGWGGHYLHAQLNRDGKDVAPPGGNQLSLAHNSDLDRVLVFHQHQFGRGKLFLHGGVAFWDAGFGHDKDLILGVSWILSM